MTLKIREPETHAWRRASSLPFQKLDEEILVVDPRTRSVHLLNPSATRIWELLQTPASEARLLVSLCAEFDAPVEAIRADLVRSLADLEEKGLIGRDEASSGTDGPSDAAAPERRGPG
jgi:PqqD family protein of HPr-rel-A system